MIRFFEKTPRFRTGNEIQYEKKELKHTPKWHFSPSRLSLKVTAKGIEFSLHFPPKKSILDLFGTWMLESSKNCFDRLQEISFLAILCALFGMVNSRDPFKGCKRDLQRLGIKRSWLESPGSSWISDSISSPSLAEKRCWLRRCGWWRWRWPGGSRSRRFEKNRFTVGRSV